LTNAAKMKTLFTKNQDSATGVRSKRNALHGIKVGPKMNDDAFAKLVAEEVKNRVPRDAKEVLFQQENWDRWKRALIVLVENLNQQILNINEDIDTDTDRYSKLEDGTALLSSALAAYESRRKKIERFLFHVQNRLNQVEKMIETGVRIEDEATTKLLMLQNAIKTHRRMMYEFNLEETELDKALWAVLDGKWEFNNVTSID
jgi:chromosome segregation ATPase